MADYCDAPPMPPRNSNAPNLDDIDRRLKALEARERELDARENALKQREISGGDSGSFKKLRPPNWPGRPWPKPFVHQDIRGEIAAGGGRNVVLTLYYHWYLTLVALLYNVACAIAVLVKDSSAGPNLGVAIAEALLWPPISLFIFRMQYNALRTFKPTRVFLFFALFLFQIAVHGFAVVGLKGSGFCCVVRALDMGNRSVKIMCWVDAAVWAASTALCFYVWVHMRIQWNKYGGLYAAQRAKAKATQV
eukprot:m51a1_g3946 hypothetical protein (249) ;mRNA; f:302869-303856